MGILESKPSSSQLSEQHQQPQEQSPQHDENKFRDEVRRSAENFKNLVMNNKVMMFSATYCTYCTVAKVRQSITVEHFHNYCSILENL